MKYVIRENLVVSFKGEFAEADESQGQFIFDTDADHQLTKATLIGIAEANNITFGKKDNVSTLVEKIDQNFLGIKLKEVSVMSEAKKDEAVVEEIVIAGMEAEKDNDTMLVEIVNAGVSFKNAGKLFKKVMETKGYVISAKKRKEEIGKLIKELDFNPETSADVKSMVGTITEKVADTSTKQAMGALKRWAKDEEVELPKVEKEETSSGGFAGAVREWMSANMDASSEELTKWIVDDKGKKEALAKRFVQWFEFVKECVNPDGESKKEAA